MAKKTSNKNNNTNILSNYDIINKIKDLATELNLNNDDLYLINDISRLDNFTQAECYRLYKIFNLLLSQIAYIFKYNPNNKDTEFVRIPFGILFKMDNEKLIELIEGINILSHLLNQKIKKDSINNDNIRTMRFMGVLSTLFSIVIMNTSQNGQDATLPKTRNGLILDKNGNEINNEILPSIIRNYQNKKSGDITKEINNDLPDPDFLCNNMEFKQMLSENLKATPSQILNKSIGFSLFDTKIKDSIKLPAYDGFCFNFYDAMDYYKFWMFCCCDKHTCELINHQINNLQQLTFTLMNIDEKYDLTKLFKDRHKKASSIYKRPTVFLKLWMVFYNSKWFIHNGFKWNTSSKYTNKINENDYVDLSDALRTIFDLSDTSVQLSMKSFVSQFIDHWMEQINARNTWTSTVSNEDYTEFLTYLLDTLYTALGDENFKNHLFLIIDRLDAIELKNIATNIISNKWGIDVNEILNNRLNRR